MRLQRVQIPRRGMSCRVKSTGLVAIFAWPRGCTVARLTREIEAPPSLLSPQNPPQKSHKSSELLK